MFRPLCFWDDGPRPEETAFELLGAALNDVAGHCTDSSRFDSGLLQRLASYRRLFARGRLRRIALPDAALPKVAIWMRRLWTPPARFPTKHHRRNGCGSSCGWT